MARLLRLAPLEALRRHHGLLKVVLRVQVHHVRQVVLSRSQATRVGVRRSLGCGHDSEQGAFTKTASVADRATKAEGVRIERCLTSGTVSAGGGAHDIVCVPPSNAEHLEQRLQQPRHPPVVTEEAWSAGCWDSVPSMISIASPGRDQEGGRGTAQHHGNIQSRGQNRTVTELLLKSGHPANQSGSRDSAPRCLGSLRCQLVAV